MHVFEQKFLEKVTRTAPNSRLEFMTLWPERVWIVAVRQNVT